MTSPAGITVYWRPGCLFCSSLVRQLDQWSIPYDASNIWEDLAAAAIVRGAAGGSETVPTVQVGDRFLINPTIDAVLATVHASLLLAAASTRRWSLSGSATAPWPSR
ncbi:MAG: NrdH-redoxin [Actinomycetota bacterium]|nr:NrdH-redoxin [Actinomycetota bacterium]